MEEVKKTSPPSKKRISIPQPPLDSDDGSDWKDDSDTDFAVIPLEVCNVQGQLSNVFSHLATEAWDQGG